MICALLLDEMCFRSDQIGAN